MTTNEQQVFPDTPIAAECDNENQQQSFPNIPIAVECDIENQRPSLPQLPIAENDIVNLTENDEKKETIFAMCCKACCNYIVSWAACIVVSSQFLVALTTDWAFIICFIAWGLASTIGFIYKGFRLLFIFPIIFWLFQ